MRGASRGVLKWSSQTGPARRTAPAFVWAGRGLPLRCAAPAASPRKRSSGRPRDSGRRVLRPVREELSLDWDWAKPQPRATPASPRPRKPGPWTEIAAAVRREARGLRHWPRTPDGVTLAPRVRGAALLGAPLPSFFARCAKQMKERHPTQNPGAARRGKENLCRDWRRHCGENHRHRPSLSHCSSGSSSPTS
jgi:hypothetical protein